MTFRERLAWLGRMPTHYRILFGSQLVLTAIAIRYRMIVIERRRKELESPSNTTSTTTDATT